MTDLQADTQRRAEVDLDHHSPEFREDPHRKFRAMRESGCPVARSEHYDGFWATLGLARTVTRDTEFHGQPLCQGDRAVLMWGAANRDPAMFDDPDVLDLSRENAKKHMSFGVGVHRCLGSDYAKVMFQLTQVLERLPDFELAGDYERYDDAGEVYAVSKLPVKFTPCPRSS